MVSKPRLATHGFSFTPKAFRIPEEADQFLEEVGGCHWLTTTDHAAA